MISKEVLLEVEPQLVKWQLELGIDLNQIAKNLGIM